MVVAKDSSMHPPSYIRSCIIKRKRSMSVEIVSWYLQLDLLYIQVQLAPFNRNYLNASVLWTESDKGQGFQEIRMQSNTSAAFHAFYVHEPDSNKALLALRPRNDSNNQSWKFQEIM